MSDEKRRTKAEQSEATTRKLVRLGREIFTEHGYSGASMEDLVQRAGVTRGALYHHFSSKEGLFRAALDDVQGDVAQRIEEATQHTSDLWEQLLAGCQAFLAASLDPQVQRIMLIDAPAVLGWESWRQMDAEHSLRLLKEALASLIEIGMIEPQPVDALAHLLSGAMNEAALWIVRSEQPEKALAEATSTLERLLGALRTEA